MGGDGTPAVAGPSLQPPQALVPSLDPDVGTSFQRTYENLSCLEQAIKELQANGLFKPAHLLKVELDNERRQLRALAREDGQVMLELEARSRVQEQKQLAIIRRAEEEHEQVLTAKRIKASIAETDKQLKNKQQALKDLENTLEERHRMKTFTPEYLGQGQKRAGGAKGQRARFDVLDRLAHLGVGLSPEQKNDWAWFKSAWDAKMVAEHDKEWPMLFSGFMQQVLEDMAQQGGSNAFSSFVHQETLRCLSDQIALRVPGAH